MREQLVEQLKEGSIAGDEQTAKETATGILKAELDPVTVIEQHLAPAMRIVGSSRTKTTSR